MDSNSTLDELVAITDPGLFEKIATAVLRTAKPAYSNIVRTGVNAKGQPIKDPVDGICLITEHSTPHMIVAHHTITAKTGLKKKWLHEPAKTQSRKPNAGKTDAGDLIKTIAAYEKQLQEMPDLKCTLILTSTVSPASDVVLAVETVACKANIAIDFWDGSKIAQFLDADGDGQYIRKQYLGIHQQRLSRSLLGDLSKKSLDSQPFYDEAANLIEREFDVQLMNTYKAGVTLVAAASGLGKSVACYKRLTTHIKERGYGLILPHELLENTQTLSQAVNSTLRFLCPTLDENAGTDTFKFVSKSKPLIIVIEDINKATDPSHLLEKLLAWHQLEYKSGSNNNWQIFCPIWPAILHSMDENKRKTITELVVNLEIFTTEEGTAAVRAKCRSSQQNITTLESTNIAAALGNDPLLIALYDATAPPMTDKIIDRFINNQLTKLCKEHGDFLADDYKDSIFSLFLRMFEEKELQPFWRTITKFNLSCDEIKMLRQVANQGRIFRMHDGIHAQSIVFRHDRIYDNFAAGAIASEMASRTSSNLFITDPFYARWVGMALNKDEVPLAILDKLSVSTIFDGPLFTLADG